jgi:hypothetical protein
VDVAEGSQMDDKTQRTETDRPAGGQPNSAANDARPVYKKPVLRRYDQIEQVKPYGPSELEAG